MTRVAIVGGVRTPFVKAGGVFQKHSFVDLGVHTLQALQKKLDLKPDGINEFIFGTVLLDPRTPNFAREVIFRSGFPPSISAHSVSNNCISGLVAATMVAEAIQSGRIKVGVAGGAESMSRPTLTLSRRTEDLFLRLARAKSLGERLSIVAQFRPGNFIPLPPSPKEPSTGLTMGQHCELTAKEFNIPRELQDEIALRSHQRAAAAQKTGHFKDEIIPLDGIELDNLVRADTSAEKLAKLPPVFDKSEKGTISAGNSSALTDGASLVCLMAEDEAKRQGRKILGYINDVEYAAIDPKDGLLMAPGIALPRLMKRQGLSVNTVDLFEVHEAFGAQVAANLQVWEKGWTKYSDVSPIGRIPPEKMNVNGGSIAIGHPFAATGGRLILSILHQLERQGGNVGIISVCAAGAMACAMAVSRS